jgi:transcriptional regulator with XRE-family HTH domain
VSVDGLILAGGARGTLAPPAGTGHPVTVDEIACMRVLRYEDGLTAAEVAGLVGRSEKTVFEYAPGRIGKVPNDKLRAAFEASGLSSTEVARRAGWWYARGDRRGRRTADGARVRRALGLQADLSGSSGCQSMRRLVDAEIASVLAEAIGVMPWEVMPDEDVA